MHTILTLVRKDIARFLRNRPAVFMTFLIPIAIIYIFGFVFNLNGKDTGPRGLKLAVAVETAGPATDKLVNAFKAEKSFSVVTEVPDEKGQPRPLTETDARRLIHDRELNFAVIIPRDLFRQDGIGINLRILSNPRNEIESQMVTGLLQKTIFSSVPQLLGESVQQRAKKYLGDARFETFNEALASSITTAFGGDKDAVKKRVESGDFGFENLTKRAAPANPTASSAAPEPAPKNRTGDFLSSLVKIDTVQVVGKRIKSPQATRVVGGYAIMFLLFAVSASSASFFDEKNAGVFQRVLSAPVSRAQLLLSHFLFGVLMGLLQLIAMFTAGHFLYGIDVFGHLGNLLVVCTVAAAACTSFGMLVAAISPNAQAASGLSTFVVMIMSATGGAWFPISFMPEFMQKIGKLTLVYWSMEGFTQVLWAENTLRELSSTIGILLAITTGVLAISLWRLNQKKIFD
jgi:ABC-2 type transport system permease protein